MLSSGNGRHRRPRQAPAAMVAAAATGAGMALPLLGAGAAHAADGGTWDKVAVCETGGLWSANADTGFYGGLAITQDSWDRYGGGAYAERPDLASRSQQIAVAEKMLTALGPGAWPGCEWRTGLHRDAAGPSTDPGHTATPAPGTAGHILPAPAHTPPFAPGPPWAGLPSTPSAPRYSPPPVPGGPWGTIPSVPSYSPPVTSPAPTASPVGPTTPAGGTPGGPATTPVTPGTSAPASPPGTPIPGPGNPAAPGPSTPSGPSAPVTGSGGRHAKPYSPTDDELAAADQATRTQVYSVAETGTPDHVRTSTRTSGSGNRTGANNSGKSGTSSSNAPDSYTVDYGDSLSGIASVQHVDGGWRHLFDVNHHLIGDDPNLIKPGQILNLG
jgi:hypothetical protein